MAGEYMGYNSKAELEKAINGELAQMEYHDNGGRDPAPQPQAEPRVKVKGKPGSQERFEYAASLIEDPELRQQLVGELAWGQVGVELQNALHRIKADEGREDFYDYDDPAYRPETVEAFTSAARLIASTGSPELYAAFQNELGEDSPLAEYLAPAVEHAETEGRVESYGLQQAAEEKRLGEREQLLQREYQDIERRTGPAGIAAADRLAQAFDQEGLLYRPEVDDDHLRAQLRATAETVRAQERGMTQATFLTGLDKEIARSHGPGSSWNDAEREKWEGELRASTVESVERAFGDPNDHADRAIDGMINDDRRAATGKGSFERALDAELDKHNSHARQNSPHLRALAEADAREWERTHDESGFPTTATDGLGHEHRRRGSPGE